MQWSKRVVAVVLAGALAFALAGCGGGGEVQSGVYKGREEWSISSEGDASGKKIEVELEDGETVMAELPGERPEIGSTVKVQKKNDGSWKVVE